MGNGRRDRVGLSETPPPRESRGRTPALKAGKSCVFGLFPGGEGGRIACRPLFLDLVGRARNGGHTSCISGDCLIFSNSDGVSDIGFEGVSSLGAIGLYLERISAVLRVVAQWLKA